METMITTLCKRAAAMALTAGTLLGRSFAADTAAELEHGFLQPPGAARPWVYYFVKDVNLTREDITADFEALRQAGV